MSHSLTLANPYSPLVLHTPKLLSVQYWYPAELWSMHVCEILHSLLRALNLVNDSFMSG